MSGNIIIYLHIAMIFAQHNDYLRNICCTIFGMCCFLLLDNLIFNSIWIAHVHLLRRDVKFCTTLHQLVYAYFPKI